MSNQILILVLINRYIQKGVKLLYLKTNFKLTIKLQHARNHCTNIFQVFRSPLLLKNLFLMFWYRGALKRKIPFFVTVCVLMSFTTDKEIPNLVKTSKSFSNGDGTKSCIPLLVWLAYHSKEGLDGKPSPTHAPKTETLL